MRRFQTLSLAIYLIASSVIIALSLRAADGHLIYSLDDPYIHLAVAENILKGGYGVNLSEYSSPSSSILWPLLMALALGLGLGSLAPLIVGYLASATSVWLISGFFWRHAFGETTPRSAQWAQILLPALLILSINAIALPMTGMEHPLHILATILVILGLESLAEQNRGTPALLIGIVLCPLIRFEGAALSLAAIAALAWRRKYAQAIALSLILIALLGAYVLTMNSLGLPALPSSVMKKSAIASTAMEGGAYSTLSGVLMNVKTSLGNTRGSLFLIASALIFIGIFRGEAKPDPARAIVGLPVIFALIAHIAFGQYGWFSRYEIYAVAMVLMGTVFVYSESLRNLKALQAKNILLLMLVGMLGQEYFGRALGTPAASRNVYQQQYQMHRFATEYFPHAVAVNDLGWVAFRNDRYVLDLWGLGSEDARKLAGSKTLSAGSLQRLTRKQAISFAMIYDEWFGKAIPTSWCRIAVLHTSQVSTASGEVVFYLLDRSRYPEMLSALAKFSSSLPRGANLSVPGCGQPQIRVITSSAGSRDLGRRALKSSAEL